jgi:hypothetical protein
VREVKEVETTVVPPQTETTVPPATIPPVKVPPPPTTTTKELPPPPVVSKPIMPPPVTQPVTSATRVLETVPATAIVPQPPVQPKPQPPVQVQAQNKKDSVVPPATSSVVPTHVIEDMNIPVRAVEVAKDKIQKKVESMTQIVPNSDAQAYSDSQSLTTQIIQDAVSLEVAKRDLAKRGGLELYADSDRDGVSDYDEVHIYMTDPRNAYTSGSSLTDGERILNGFDVHSKSDERVLVESPLTTSAATSSAYSVSSIELIRMPTMASNPSISTSTPVSSVQEIPTQSKEQIAFSGTALPNSFVTLYIFSTPIVVTVKADQDGVWHYAFDKELENGQHEMYVATVDNAGKIIARSPSIPFVKTAEAVSYTPPMAASVPAESAADIFRNYLILAAALAVLVFALGVLVRLGRSKARPVESVVQSASATSQSQNAAESPRA